MLILKASTAELHLQIIALFQSNGVAFSVATSNAVSVSGPFWGDTHDLVIENLYEPVFGKWCILQCDDDDDTADLRKELLEKGVPFIEENCDSEQGFVLSSANSPV